VEDSTPLFDSAFLTKLEQLHLLSRKIFRGQQHANRRSRQTGSSLEFADYRNYTSGDDLRTVDWNVYGRLNRLFVKLFEAEQDLRVSILIDCSTSMHWLPEQRTSTALTKFDHARRIAAALAYVALANLDRVNLFPFAGELGIDLGFVRGKQQFHAVLEFLKRLSRQSRTVDQGHSRTRMRASFRTFAHRLKQRGLVFVLSDLFDPEAADALGFLRQQKFEASALQVLDQAELDPALGGELKGDLQLVDAESGDAFDVRADSTLLDSYRAEFAAFNQAVERDCRRRAIGFIQTTTAVPFEDLVLHVLRSSRLVQ
jgi:uncharacterized protein (DUF58 family)